MIGWLRKWRRGAPAAPAAGTTAVRSGATRRRPVEEAPPLWQRLPWKTLGAWSAVAAGLALLLTPLLGALDRPVQRVVVEGPFQRVAPPEIERVVRERALGGMASVDLDEVRAAVEELAWVDRASLQRRWPSTLRVVVTEQVAAARWNDSGLLNTRGELFISEARFVPPELPRLAGPDGSEARVAELYLRAQGPLLENGLRLSGVRLDERGAWELELNGGVTVRLGRQAMEQRLERFIGLASPMVARRIGEISYVDMRYANGFSVGWTERSALAVGPHLEPRTDG
jgi:cell division protein FtsQ